MVHVYYTQVLARIQLGMAHHRLKQTAEARAVFQDAEAAFGTSPDALNYHGESLIHIHTTPE